MKTIEVKIFDLADDKVEKAQVLERYNMPVPTSVKIHLTADTIKRMKKAKNFLVKNRFSTLDFLSPRRADQEHCYLELFHDDEEIVPSKYVDFERFFDTFDYRTFRIVVDTIYSHSFHLELLYVNGWSEFSFRTENFSIDTKNPH